MSKKIKLLLLVLVALIITYYWPQWTRTLPLQVKEIDLNEPEPYKSKEECYKAVENYQAGCLRKKTPAACIVEQYCDDRGCC